MGSWLKVAFRPGLTTLAGHALKVVAAGGLWLLIVTTASAATDTLDAHQDGTSSSNSLLGMAQSFKAENTGTISRVQLWIGRASTTPADGAVKIVRLTAGRPDESSVVATLPLTAFNNNCCGWVTFTFNSGTLTANTSYAIV